MHELNDACGAVREVQAREPGSRYWVCCLARRPQLVDRPLVALVGVKYTAVAMALVVLAAVALRGILEL